MRNLNNFYEFEQKNHEFKKCLWKTKKCSQIEKNNNHGFSNGNGLEKCSGFLKST